MQSADRAEFDAQICALFGAYGREAKPAQLDGYWKGLQQMAIVQLARVIEAALEDLGKAAEPASRKPPNVGELWQIARSLRSRTQVSTPPPAAFSASDEFDTWAMAANRHLLAYVLTRTARRSRRYAPDWTGAARPGPRPFERTAILCRWKNYWADQMRQAADESGVDPNDQREVWENCMARAETEIDALGARAAA